MDQLLIRERNEVSPACSRATPYVVALAEDGPWNADGCPPLVTRRAIEDRRNRDGHAMTAFGRTLILGAALLPCLAGTAVATEKSGADSAPRTNGRTETGPSTGNVGAGGLTGSGATKDGARTGTPNPSRAPGSSTPAAGTAR